MRDQIVDQLPCALHVLRFKAQFRSLPNRFELLVSGGLHLSENLLDGNGRKLDGRVERIQVIAAHQFLQLPAAEVCRAEDFTPGKAVIDEGEKANLLLQMRDLSLQLLVGL